MIPGSLVAVLWADGWRSVTKHKLKRLKHNANLKKVLDSVVGCNGLLGRLGWRQVLGNPRQSNSLVGVATLSQLADESDERL